MSIPRSPLAAALCALCLSFGAAGAARAATWATEAARPLADAAGAAYEGVVEALRQTVVAAQVPGAVVELAVQVGDTVRAGQLLARIDARAADQAAAASDAQLQSARVALDIARSDVERQRALFQRQFISAAALDRAEADFKATQAQVDAQRAQAGAARTQTGFFVVRAPYAGVVSELPVSLGDMAMPGKPLLTLVDPGALRVSASLPQTVAARLPPGAALRIELPGLPAARQWQQPTRVQLLPTMDAATHTVQLRADLPTGLGGVLPGQFARLWLPADGRDANPSVPRQAIVRRGEMTALYVLASDDRPQLRQVRLGRAEGERVEVLAGLSAGERVLTDPQAAARAR